MPEFTDAQIVESIHAALREGKVEVVGSLIAVLAVQNPRRAERIRDSLLAASRIAASSSQETP